jgi:F-type H+-transporting ATPase subunit h
MPHDSTQAADSHKGQVREFQNPAAPKAPAVPSSSELSSQLEAYAAAEPDHAEVAASSSEGALTEGGDVNAFLREAAADVKVEAHH